MAGRFIQNYIDGRSSVIHVIGMIDKRMIYDKTVNFDEVIIDKITYAILKGAKAILNDVIISSINSALKTGDGLPSQVTLYA
jgi:hypothetical protein